MTHTTIRNWLTTAFAAATLTFCGVAPAAAGHTPLEPTALIGPINQPAIEHEIELEMSDEATAAWPELSREAQLEPTPTGTTATVTERSAAIALPLPPAVLTGGVMLAGNFVLAGLFKRRRI